MLLDVGLWRWSAEELPERKQPLPQMHRIGTLSPAALSGPVQFSTAKSIVKRTCGD